MADDLSKFLLDDTRTGVEESDYKIGDEFGDEFGDETADEVPAATLEALKRNEPVTFQLLRQEEHFVAIEKPQGYHVHQPEDPRRRVDRGLICLTNLRDQIGRYLYPVHRLDVGTDGVLVFALTKTAASSLSKQFQRGSVKKTYFAIVRGWSDDSGVIDIPLGLDSTGEPVDSLTRYRTHARVELPFAVGKRHKSARYSLVEARPETGRFHQVRRHMARLAHPLVGDRVHGDSHHNRFFREHFGEPGLWLKAKSIAFEHPVTQERVVIESAWSDRWKRIGSQLGLCLPETDQGSHHQDDFWNSIEGGSK